MSAVFAALFLAALITQWGCGGGSDNKTLLLAATSDLEESGVVQAWVKDFQSRSGYEVETVFAPDQDVLEMAMHGECDLLITHEPDEEEQRERMNYLESRQEVMHDDYVVVGPPDDPAGAGEAENAVGAFRKIAEAKKPFILRTDGSGTAYKERMTWAASGVEEVGGWLIETEAGTDDTLRQASLEGAYTLSDRSNFQRLSGELGLEILLEGDEGLNNPYHVMQVSGLPYPDTNGKGAQEFINYLISNDARRFFNLGAWEPPSG